MCSCSLHVTKSTIKRLKQGKQGFEFIKQHKCQPHYQQFKMQGNTFEPCEKGEFKIFPFFKLHSCNKYLREKVWRVFRVFSR